MLLFRLFLSALSFNMSYDIYMMMYKTTKAIMLHKVCGVEMENGFDSVRVMI